MEMKPVTSSQISAIGYDPKSKKLHIRFADRTNRKTGQVFPGSTYEYDDVEPAVHAALMAADADPALSVGSHFGAHVKASGYTYRKLEG